MELVDMVRQSLFGIRNSPARAILSVCKIPISKVHKFCIQFFKAFEAIATGRPVGIAGFAPLRLRNGFRRVSSPAFCMGVVSLPNSGTYGYRKQEQKESLNSVLHLIERDNGSDHRVRTIDLPFQKHAQAGLRVHRIVIPRSRLTSGEL